jgi:hypothetical protein
MAVTYMKTELRNARLNTGRIEKDQPGGALPNGNITETSGTRLDAVRLQIDRARDDLLNQKERLMAARVELEQQIGALEAELQILDSLDRASKSEVRPAEAMLRDGSRRGRPLNQRVIEILQHNGSGLTSRQIRGMLDLNYRESRNLGPVLNQLAKLGKIRNVGRGAPWKLIQRRPR